MVFTPNFVRLGLDCKSSRIGVYGTTPSVLNSQLRRRPSLNLDRLTTIYMAYYFGADRRRQNREIGGRRRQGRYVRSMNTNIERSIHIYLYGHSPYSTPWVIARYWTV